MKELIKDISDVKNQTPQITDLKIQYYDLSIIFNIGFIWETIQLNCPFTLN